MSQKKRDTQFVNVVLQDDKGNILLSCGRKSAASDRDDDSIYFVAPRSADEDAVEISLQLTEGEDFLELVIPLVSDDKDRPFGGLLFVSTIIGDSGARLSFCIENTDDYMARVELVERRQGDETAAKFDADREALERFLYAALEGLCDDMEDDD